MRTIPLSRLSAVLIAGLVAAGCGGDAEEQVPSEAPPAAEPAAPAAPAPGAAVNTANLPAGVTAEMVTQGQQLFAGSGICYTCHGPNGQGTPLAPNLTDQTWLQIVPSEGNIQEQIVTLIKTGVSQPVEYPAPMPAMGGASLTDEQINALAAYVRSLGGLPQQG